MTKILILSLTSLLPLLAFSKTSRVQIAGENLSFTYQSFDGDRYVRCQHEVENLQAGDWKVICEDAGFRREYTVHLWITRYTKQQAPKTSFETLYWVTEKYPERGTGYSSTQWLHLAEESNFYGAQLSVGVDKESAGLYLEVKPR